MTAFGLDRPPTLERQLKDSAPQILTRLRERGIARIGVLKFRVQKPGGRVSDNVGTLNMFLAERLEAALALEDPVAEAGNIELVRKASQTAQQIPGASHLSEAGRQKLFSRRYPPAWGAQPMQVDAFLTGVAQFAPDNKSFDLGILAIRPSEPGLELLLPPVKVATTGAILHEIGESFQVRSIFDSPEPTHLAELARQVRESPEQCFPLSHDPVVVLRIFYDRQPVTLTFRDGQAWIPEPSAGQKVTFELERLDRADFALGVVLKVNGENTLYCERMRDLDCSKWVLTRDKPKGSLRGFQMRDHQQAKEFRVASAEESKNLEVYYGEDVGTISMVVFREQLHAAEPAAAEPAADERAADEPAAEAQGEQREDAPDLDAILKAQFPEQTPPDLKALQDALRGVDDAVQARGVILGGREIRQAIETTDKNWEPEPLMSAVIHYYSPQTHP
jgi:hypothetical protein